HESGGPVAPVRRGAGTQKADRRHFSGLLCPRRRRPGRRCTHERDEFAAPHSITWSARSRAAVGTSMPSAFAVLRLRTVSNLVARSTGNSPGLAPLRILST